MHQLNEVIRQWDEAYEKARTQEDTKGMDHAESQRSEAATEREGLNLFKARLGKFSRVYNYIAQLVELGDAGLENFAAFAKLLARRLDGIPVEQVDISGIVMAHYEIQPVISDAVGEGQALYGVGTGGEEPRDREKEFLSEIIERLNTIFGDVSDTENQQHFTQHITSITTSHDVVREQIDKNTKEQALNGDLPNAVNQAIVTAMTSHGDLARVLLKDPQSMASFVSLVYDIAKSGEQRA
jgi:type I restriction enzyme R subunit